MNLKYIVNEETANMRIDKAIRILDRNGKSRTVISQLIKNNMVLVNGMPTKANYIAKINDVIMISEPAPKSLDLEPEDLNIDVIYEDADVAVVYKPEGMTVHPAQGSESDTLVNGLLYEMNSLSTINGVIRPGIVHRIDKDTSGLLMIAKNDKAHESLSNQLRNHTVTRKYIAICYGEISEERGRIDAPIGRDPKDRKKMAVVADGKRAITNFKVLKRCKDFSMIECVLETGRTHQIRVHLQYIGHPLVGDKVYGPKKVISNHGQFLHAKVIGFIHPTTNEYMEFDSKIPDYFTEFWDSVSTK